MGDNDKTIGWSSACAGFAIGGALGYTFFRIFSEPDEDRPPIRVKSGSLIFQSGDATTGKRWRKLPQSHRRWQQKHPKGKKVQWLILERGSEVWLTKSLSITYSGKTFDIQIEAPDDDHKRLALSIDGDDLEEAPGIGGPQLLYPHGPSGGPIMVKFTNWQGENITWNNSGEFDIWQI